MSQAQFYTRTQKLAALRIAMEYHQISPAEYPHVSRAEKRAIAETRGSILRLSFVPVRNVVVRPVPRLA